MIPCDASAREIQNCFRVEFDQRSNPATGSCQTECPDGRADAYTTVFDLAFRDDLETMRRWEREVFPPESSEGMGNPVVHLFDGQLREPNRGTLHLVRPRIRWISAALNRRARGRVRRVLQRDLQQQLTEEDLEAPLPAAFQSLAYSSHGWGVRYRFEIGVSLVESNGLASRYGYGFEMFEPDAETSSLPPAVHEFLMQKLRERDGERSFYVNVGVTMVVGETTDGSQL